MPLGLGLFVTLEGSGGNNLLSDEQRMTSMDNYCGEGRLPRGLTVRTLNSGIYRLHCSVAEAIPVMTRGYTVISLAAVVEVGAGIALYIS